ncbi:hypothetical protein MLD38_021306 [Melastoma candidum]|uniref:Uncharacterized protein n=1 Tax=Melastoma candidum TaxID=119954 RepID=A0ACB9QEX5_9MYRT|nr:hypothetical protein MLD38_021306 [Melastoma candidum]
MKFLSSTTHEIIHVAPSQPPHATTTTCGGYRAYVTIVVPVVLFGLVFALALNGAIRCFLGRRLRNAHPNLLKGAAWAWVVAARSAVFVSGVGMATECTVCLSEYTTGEEVTILSGCNHGFHGRCIEEWLRRKNSTCPNCRTACSVSRSSPVG